MGAKSEVRWWALLTFTVVRRHRGLALILVALLWLSAPASILVLTVCASVVVPVRVWAVRQPASFARWVGPVRGRLWRRVLRRHWVEVCTRCRLAPVFGDAPAVLRARVAWPHVQVLIGPALGQTVHDFEDAAEALRTGFAAARLRIEPQGVRDVLLTFTVVDQLQIPFEASPDQDDDSLCSVRMGRREDGAEWRLPIGPHTLVAGCSGSGKGSVFWSFAFGLAPAVRDGRVQLHGVDLKGGMEILMGHGLFTSSATTAAEAVVVLETLVARMQQRTARYAGRVRNHVPTPDEPLQVVMIDELAALTAYCSERDLQRRAESAINLLCSQGRAPGFVVFACLQDPRKEVIPSRGLFTQMVGLRLKDLSETSMVLGEVAVTTGAHCHRITRDVPGTGYVVPEDGGPPVRVRAGFASDDLIRAVAQEYATPTRVPVVAAGALEDPGEPAPRRSRAGKAP